MTPLYDVVVVLHVLAAVAGFGALLATGSYADAARRSGAGPVSVAVRRYFRPGRNLASAALYLVPVLGVLLLGLGHWQDASAPFPWVGLFLWLVATGVTSSRLWPSERAIQRLLSQTGDVDVAALTSACRRCERAAAITSVCFVIALFFMVVQPG